jgi:ABC-type nitrate/sulfonate/bicarbonate transport system permease component
MSRAQTTAQVWGQRLLATYPLVLFAVAWEATAQLGLVSPIFLPALSDVLTALPGLIRDGEILGPLAVSLYRALVGLLIALTIGLCIGFCMARIGWVRWLIDPLMSFAFPAPKIAFLPIFILWLGIDHMSKIALVAFTCVFPFIVSAYAGATTVPTHQLWAARAMGSSDTQILYRIILPASLPSVLSGVRVAVPYAIVTAFTAEMIAGGGGLGGTLVFAQRFFEINTVFACLLTMLLTGYLVDYTVLRVRAHLLRWLNEDPARS